MSKSGQPPSFSAIPISFHSVDSVRKKNAAKGKTRDQKIVSVKQLSKIAFTVHTLYRLSGGHCTYGTYVVPPVIEE